MPRGYQISSECRGLARLSTTACLKVQIFHTKVDSSKAHWATPGTLVVRFAARGQDKIRARTVKRPRTQRCWLIG